MDFLDEKCSEIDAMLSKTRSSIEEYKKLKQAVITQAVTKGVRGEREMKDSGVDYIGQIPAKWVLGKLRNVGNTQNGISKSSEFFGKGFPFVSYSDVYKITLCLFAVSGLVESTPEEQERYSVKGGRHFLSPDFRNASKKLDFLVFVKRIFPMPRLLVFSSEYVHFQTNCIHRMQSIILRSSHFTVLSC